MAATSRQQLHEVRGTEWCPSYEGKDMTEYAAANEVISSKWDEVKELCLNDIFGEVIYDAFALCKGVEFGTLMREGNEDWDALNRIGDYVLDAVLERGYEIEDGELWWMSIDSWDKVGNWYTLPDRHMHGAIIDGRDEWVAVVEIRSDEVHRWKGRGKTPSEALSSSRLSPCYAVTCNVSDGSDYIFSLDVARHVSLEEACNVYDNYEPDIEECRLIAREHADSCGIPLVEYDVQVGVWDCTDGSAIEFSQEQLF